MELEGSLVWSEVVFGVFSQEPKSLSYLVHRKTLKSKALENRDSSLDHQSHSLLFIGFCEKWHVWKT